MAMLSEIFQKPKPILGQIQLLALPGAHGWEGQWDTLTARAEQEATALATGGVDGLIIENRHDGPFTEERMDTAGAIAMALLVRRLKQFTGLPVGLSVLHNDPETALAIAVNTEASFIRLSVLAGARITESGVMNSQFHKLLHYRNKLKTELPPLLADVSLNHLSPGLSKPATDAPVPQNRLTHLIRVAQSFPTLMTHPAEQMAVVLSDCDIDANDLCAFKNSTGWPVCIEIQNRPDEADAYFAESDGLLLDAGIRKNASLQPNLPPSIDMTRVEETVNRLRGVKPVTEMDPDIFLRR
jgi:hypothetical protein